MKTVGALPVPLTARRMSQTLVSERSPYSESRVRRPWSLTMFIVSFLSPGWAVFACGTTQPRKGERRTAGEGSEATLRGEPTGQNGVQLQTPPAGLGGPRPERVGRSPAS